MVESSIQLGQFMDDLPGSKSRGGCASCGSGNSSGSARCGNGLEKIYPTTAIRFGYMRYIGEFTHPEDMKFTCGARVIIQTKRGLEMGEQVSLTCNGCDKSVTRDQMRSWVDASGEESYMFEAGRILREATAADLTEYTRIQNGNRAKKYFCQQVAGKQKLPLSVVECESVFGGERIIFYFKAAERIDFRDMVKELAREYRTRIELRQIGARDEARLLADFETCGREVCCKVFLKTLRPISMRMAKVQKATLDPSQVSGRCGRLKCCLRYEHLGYEELDKKIPRVGVRIRTNHGVGVVVNRQILTQLVQIKKDNSTLVTVVAEDITEVNIQATESAPETEDAVDNSVSAKNRNTTETAQPVQDRQEKSSQKTRPPRRDGKSNSEEKKPEADEPGHDKTAPSSEASSSDAQQQTQDEHRQRGRSRHRRRRRGRGQGGHSGSGPNRPSNPDSR